METLLLIVVVSVALGIAVFLATYALRYTLSLRIWLFGAAAVVLIPFGLAWCVTSIEEGEPFAGYMGVVVFSGLGALCALLTYLQLQKEQPAWFDSTGTKQRQASPPLVPVLLATALMSIGAWTLPYTVAANRLAAAIDTRPEIENLLTQRVFADRALPRFVKKTLTYETLYGPVPDTLGPRMTQAMVYGTHDAQMVEFLDQVMNEEGRLVLLSNLLDAANQWLQSDAVYPDLTIDLQPCTQRIDDKADFVLGWMYRNFPFQEMKPDLVARFESGDIPTRFDDYMAKPPEALLPIVVQNGANVLRTTLAEAKLPASVSLQEQLAGQVSQTELMRAKSMLGWAARGASTGWALSVLALLAAFGVVFWRVPRPWPIAGVLALATSGLITLVSHPLRDIESSVYHWVVDMKSLPSPVLALFYTLVPDRLEAARLGVGIAAGVALALGLISLGVAYSSKVRHWLRWPAHQTAAVKNVEGA